MAKVQIIKVRWLVLNIPLLGFFLRKSRSIIILLYNDHTKSYIGLIYSMKRFKNYLTNFISTKKPALLSKQVWKT